ncbi:glycoside hydrolase family 19 protein [Dinoroseobacter sp. S375]|uniref:glycoside hydrolase family 19 protein n=1 Tax=Dinoroseobacter sp. S375 TaxID=3415136 RepID=UPI003C7B8C91
MSIDLKLGDTPELIKTCLREECSLEQAAYILGTIYWETNKTMKPVREAYWLSEDWRRDNLRYYPWYGRGHIQLTWETNYKRMGERLGVDLTTDPDAAMASGVSVSIAVIGCMEGAFTGKAIPDYINDTKTDYRNARRVVNGMDKADTIAGLAEDYAAALSASGYGVKVVQPTNVLATLLAALANLFKKWSKA